MQRTFSTVLFDLDGTLLDTAPDMAWALNQMRIQIGNEALDFQLIRPHVSHGSFALSRIGCGAVEGSDEFERFRLGLLQIYSDNIARETQLFDGIAEILGELESRSIPWGIVTNKPSCLTTPLLQQLELSNRAAVVISGDTVPEKKPHPAQLLLAAERLNTLPGECVYVGDAERDIAAGNAAGMLTVAALYGYLSADDTPATWGADNMVRTPTELNEWLFPT
ncbi:MAG TPA: phosphoglycolate phosphatase [Gammaproteobacteria bacterium]|nr:phosphoglycolate phosphatase [Gammaproteobacteria bacterium]